MNGGLEIPDIDNHFVHSNNEHMFEPKTQPIKLEFIVRGYMTG